MEVPFLGEVVVIVIVIVTGWKQSQLLVFLTKDLGWSLTKIKLYLKIKIFLTKLKPFLGLAQLF